MNRLTKEQLEYYRDTYDRYEGINFEDYEEMCNELIEYKSLEEELGIDLITLFKALKEGFYCIDLDNQDIRKFKAPLCFNSTSKEFYWYGSNIGYCNLKDYGNTWWLDRRK